MKAKITLLPGDGIGPEVVSEARKILAEVAAKFDHQFDYQEAIIGGIAIDQQGTALPEDSLGACLESDAVLLGAVGGPKWSDPAAKVRPEQGLLRLRKELNVFANLRPVRVFEALATASPLRPDKVKDVDRHAGQGRLDARTGGTAQHAVAPGEPRRQRPAGDHPACQRGEFGQRRPGDRVVRRTGV